MRPLFLDLLLRRLSLVSNDGGTAASCSDTNLGLVDDGLPGLEQARSYGSYLLAAMVGESLKGFDDLGGSKKTRGNRESLDLTQCVKAT